jgi:hypothetical protein
LGITMPSEFQMRRTVTGVKTHQHVRIPRKLMDYVQVPTDWSPMPPYPAAFHTKIIGT